MTDTALPKSMRTGKINTGLGAGTSKFYKRGGYVCDFCPYSDNKTCSKCVFAVWNVMGIKAGFHPKEAYRQAHKDDISASPLMQGFGKVVPMDWHGNLDHVALPDWTKMGIPRKTVKDLFPVRTLNSYMNTLKRLQVARRRIVG